MSWKVLRSSLEASKELLAGFQTMGAVLSKGGDHSPPEKVFLRSLGRTTGGVKNPKRIGDKRQYPYPTPGEP